MTTVIGVYRVANQMSHPNNEPYQTDADRDGDHILDVAMADTLHMLDDCLMSDIVTRPVRAVMLVALKTTFIANHNYEKAKRRACVLVEKMMQCEEAVVKLEAALGERDAIITQLRARIAELG